MTPTPMDEPVSLTCGGQDLHWDRLGQLWMCSQCGASLSYVSWNCGRKLECKAERIRKQSSLATRPIRHWKPY